MPNAPKTPLRNFRIPDDEYIPAKEKAEREGTTLTDVVRQKLRDYVDDEDDDSRSGCSDERRSRLGSPL